MVPKTGTKMVPNFGAKMVPKTDFNVISLYNPNPSTQISGTILVPDFDSLLVPTILPTSKSEPPKSTPTHGPET